MRIAVVQMNVSLGNADQNLSEMLEHLDESRREGARVTIFPECALTGYCFDTLDETSPHAQSIPGPATQRFQEHLKIVGGAAIFGMIEAAPDGIFNAAVLVTPDGVQAAYRKNHLPFLGIDRFAKFGDRPYAVTEFEGIRFGISICYDSAFPEAMRTLALQGADVLVLPTNFPTGAEGMTDHVLRTRAMENKVYFACSNRIGEERGWRFIGESQIINPMGHVIAKASGDAEAILYADIDPEQSRNKRSARASVQQVIDRFADRRPELYGVLTEPHSLPRPGRS